VRALLRGPSRHWASGSLGPAAGIEPVAWRVLAVFRFLALAYAVGLYAVDAGDFRHRGGAWLLLGLMAVWSVVVTIAYARPGARTWPTTVPDLVVAVAAILASRLVDSPAHIAAGAPTLPVVWSAAPVLAWAVSAGWLAGVVAALAVGVADVIHRHGLGTATVTNIVLLVLGGALVGYVVPMARRGEVALARAEARAASTRERERLSRDIHDGVLQVLALIHRRGQEIGGAATQLADLAAEQEHALRALVASERADSAGAGIGASEVDLMPMLAAYEQAGTTVSGPADPVTLPRVAAAALVAAIGEALLNVARHAGDGASSWLLVDDAGTAVSVLIRDDGVGIAADRLEEARRAGRLGVEGSIIGRMTEFGGTATISSTTGEGTEIELRLPR
jgi:signal transduction histidine kinase